jgi:hypothetical protein
MAGLAILRRLLLKEAAKQSGERSGIAQIGNVTRDIAEKKFQAFVVGAKRQGVDLDKYTEQELKYIMELNKPKPIRAIPADSPEGQGITRDLFNMLDRQSGKNVIKKDFGKPFAEEMITTERVITDIKKMKPMDSMKEANKVLKGEGRYKNLSQADREKIVNDESVTDHIFERDVPIDPEDMATGGRAGFKMGRRAFLKLMGGAAAGIGALKAGALKMFGKEAAKNIPQVVTTPSVAGKPAWFDAVVNRVIREGDDVTKQFAYKERMQVNTKQISPTEEVTVYRDLEDGSVRINYGAKMRIDETKPYERGNIGRASNDADQVDLIVREGEVIEPSIEGPMKGKVGRKTESSFEASEAEPSNVGGPEDADMEMDGIREVNNVDDLMQDVSTLEEFGTGKKLIGDKAAKAKKKREDYQRFLEDPVEQAEYLETKYGPAEKYYGDPDDYASGGLAGMLGE